MKMVEESNYLHAIHEGPIDDLEIALQHFRTSLEKLQSCNLNAILADLSATDPTPVTAIDRIIYFQHAIGVYQEMRRLGLPAIRIAILQPPEIFSDYKPGVETALTGGLECDTFSDKSSALNWLQG